MTTDQKVVAGFFVTIFCLIPVALAILLAGASGPSATDYTNVCTRAAQQNC